MAVLAWHEYFNPEVDLGNPNESGPDEWNAGHPITALGPCLLGVAIDTGTEAGNVEEITLGLGFVLDPEYAILSFDVVTALGYTPFDSANVDTSVDLDGVGASDAKVPSQLAVKTYVDNEIAGVGGGSVITPFSFTGDGSTTVFDLTDDIPSLTAIGDAANVLWFEDGIWQRPGDDFTVSGTEVTRTTAPANGAVIAGVLIESVASYSAAPFDVDDITNIDPEARDFLEDGELWVRRGHLKGLTLSNNAGDATNDIDIAAGQAAESDSPYRIMRLTSGITKRLDASWAVGTGNGGLDTGSIANGTYHVFLIQRSDTGVVDVLFSTSATSPTMPANYDRKRRIGSFVRASAAIRAFWQDGDTFNQTEILDRSATTDYDALMVFSVPTGIHIKPFGSVFMAATAASTNADTSMGSAVVGTRTSYVCGCNTSAAGGEAGQGFGIFPPIFTTDTSAQLWVKVHTNFGTLFFLAIRTAGWVDRRGQDD